MFRMLVIFILAFSTLPSVAAAEAEPCVKETQALMSINSSWLQLYREASVLPVRCFDGYFAEGVSDTIVRKMGKDWPGFINVLAAHRNNKRFFSVVLDSINATLGADDVETVFKLSQQSCPSTLAPKCKAISQRATETLTEINEPIPSGGL